MGSGVNAWLDSKEPTLAAWESTLESSSWIRAMLDYFLQKHISTFSANYEKFVIKEENYM